MTTIRQPAAPGPVRSGTELEEGSSALAVFRSRPFLLLWLSQAFTQVGGNMVLYGLTVLVFNLTRSNSAVSLLILSFLAPAVVLSAFAGVYVDRFDRRWVLVVTNLVRAALYGSLVFFDDYLAVILAVNVLVSSATTFFAPAELAMIPLVVPRSQLLTANGVFTLTLNTAFAVGFTLLGPLVVNLANPEILVAVVAGCYFVAAVFCWTLPPAPPSPVAHPDTLHEAEAAVGSFVSQFREGLGFIAAQRSVAWSLVYLGIAASVVGVLGSLGPGFATSVLGLESDDFVVVVLPLGAGLVLGVLLLNSINRILTRRQTIEIGLISLGVLLALLTVAGPIATVLANIDRAESLVDASAFVSILAVVIAIAFVAGMTYAFIAIPAQTELQDEIPEAVRGRIFGILNMLISVGSLLPIIVVGPIADIVGPMAVVIVMAVLISVVGVASVLGRGRGARRGRLLAPAEPGTTSTGAFDAVDEVETGEAPGVPVPGPSPEEP